MGHLHPIPCPAKAPPSSQKRGQNHCRVRDGAQLQWNMVFYTQQGSCTHELTPFVVPCTRPLKIQVRQRHSMVGGVGHGVPMSSMGRWSLTAYSCLEWESQFYSRTQFLRGHLCSGHDPKPMHTLAVLTRLSGKTKPQPLASQVASSMFAAINMESKHLPEPTTYNTSIKSSLWPSKPSTFPDPM